METTFDPPRPRLAAVIAVLALATDLGTGQPLGHGLRTCLISLRLGEALGLADEALRDLFYVALLQRAGCTANSFELAAWFDDDLAAHSRTYTLDFARPRAVVVDLVRHAGAGRLPLRRARTLAAAVAGGRTQIGGFLRASCEVAERLSGQLGFSAPVRQAIGQVFERWDGRGWPDGLRGEAITLPIRIARLAADAEVLCRLGGEDDAIAAVGEGAGSIYDPAVVALFRGQSAGWREALASPSPWEAVLAAEPGSRPRLRDAEFDDVLETFAHFTDLKSPSFGGHSPAVARLAAAAAERGGLDQRERVVLRRAALVHDLGQVGVAAGIWEKPGRLSDEEWERVRLHPYHTERLLARPEELARLGALAALHHERLDGSGYHRGAHRAGLPHAARVLATAEVYQAMTEPRPHRPALTADAAASAVRGEAKAGRLDGDAVEAVLAVAGHRPRRRRPWPAGLTEREVEVLRLVARGRSNREIAARLSISSHTAGHHLRHIYDKVGVSTRAAATLFAMQHDLLTEAALARESEVEIARSRDAADRRCS